MRIFENVVAAGINARLTITPTRVTVNVPAEF